MSYCSGMSLTSAATCRLFEQVRRDFALDQDQVGVAIVGAGGVGGAAIAHGVSGQLCKGSKLLLIDNRSRRLQDLVASTGQNGACSVAEANELNALKQFAADIVIVLTAAHDFKILPQHLPVGTIIIDCTTPRNTSLDLASNPEWLVIDGDLLWAPGIRHFDYGAPPGTIFACHGEVIVLAHMVETDRTNIPVGNAKANPYLGVADYEVGQKLLTCSLELGLDIPPYHSFGQPLADIRIKTHVALLRERPTAAPSG